VNAKKGREGEEKRREEKRREEKNAKVQRRKDAKKKEKKFLSVFSVPLCFNLFVFQSLRLFLSPRLKSRSGNSEGSSPGRVGLRH
jgi:hypothetical protein